MKKFRIVAILLVMCLASSCFVGSTFAKYSSTASGSDSAVVAKWSITADNDTDDSVDAIDIAVNGGSDALTFNLFDYTDTGVKDGNVDGIIAPGTEGVAGFQIVNKSDVYASCIVTFTITNDGNIPITYELDGVAVTPDNGKITKEYILSYTGGGTDTIQTNLAWDWDFGETDADITEDTGLGTQPTLPTIEVEVAVDVEQLDVAPD